MYTLKLEICWQRVRASSEWHFSNDVWLVTMYGIKHERPENLIQQFYLNKFYAEMRNNENIRTNDSFKKGPFTYISTVSFQLFDDVWKPMAPIQNGRITVPVKVRVITEQVLREDIVGHHRKIKWPFLFPPFADAALQSWERSSQCLFNSVKEKDYGFGFLCTTTYQYINMN